MPHRKLPARKAARERDKERGEYLWPQSKGRDERQLHRQRLEAKSAAMPSTTIRNHHSDEN